MKDFFANYGAAIAAILGGIGVKILDKVLTKRSETFLEGAKIRDELRSENTFIRQELEQMEADRNEWREKFYSAIEAHITELGDQHNSDDESIVRLTEKNTESDKTVIRLQTSLSPSGSIG